MQINVVCTIDAIAFTQYHILFRCDERFVINWILTDDLHGVYSILFQNVVEHLPFHCFHFFMYSFFLFFMLLLILYYYLLLLFVYEF